MSTIAVIGGGIVGASAAFHLAQSEANVVLIDSQVVGRATSAGAGIVAPGTSLRAIPEFFELAQPAVTYYPVLMEQLAELEAGETGYAVCGKLMVADTQEKAEALPAHKALFEQRRDAGMPNIGDVSEISVAEAQSMLPVLGDVHAALFISQAARVDGAKFRDAMTRAAQKLGVRIVHSSASLLVENDRVRGVQTDGETIYADAVVIATGAWSNEVLQPLGLHLPVAPQKGQIVHIDMPDQDVTNWPILDWSGPQYQLSFGPNRVVCGATREFDSGFDTRVTPAGVKYVLDEQLRLCPGLGNGTIAEIRVGLRPYAEDSVPYIDKPAGFENVIICTGHGPSGLQLGPYSGKLAAELALGKSPSTDLTHFRLDRPVTHREVTY